MLAALVVVALVVVVLALKKRASQKKIKERETDAPPASPVLPSQELQPEAVEEPVVVAEEARLRRRALRPAPWKPSLRRRLRKRKLPKKRPRNLNWSWSRSLRPNRR